jgi:hypothetical protein
LASADDAFTVHARVLRVEPLTEVAHTRSVDPNCLKPPKNAGLAATLAWDLGLGDCARREQVTSVTGYRVHYEWNDRVYSNVMDTRPEDYVAIKVRVD